MAALTGLLFDPAVRILTLTGPAGVGKSALARAAAQTPAAGRCAAAVDLSLADDVSTAWRLIAARGGVPDEGDSLPDLLSDRIGDRELLLVLDNCDLVASQISLDLASLSARCPGLRMLLTSRVALDIYDERLFPVQPFQVANSQSPPPMILESPAVRLFVERARAQRPNYEALEGDLDVIAGICAAVDGLPLAIELSARAAGMLGTRALLAQLQSGVWPTSSRLLDLPARHRTIAESLAWGDPVLSKELRRFLQQLAVCEGEFDLSTAQHLAGVSWSEMMERLEALVHKSLLQRVEQPGGDISFRMLKMVRHYYLRHQPPDGGELARTRDKHAEYFAAVADATEGMSGPEQVWRIPSIYRQLDDHGAAISHFQATGDHAAAARLLLSLGSVLEDLTSLPEMLERLLGSLERLKERGPDNNADRALLARGLETAADWSLTLGGLDGVAELLTRAGDLFRTLADHHGAARTVGRLAELGRQTGSLATAAPQAAFAVAELDRLNDRRGASAVRRTLALIESRQDCQAAENHLLRALEDLRTAEDMRAQARTLTDLARVRTAAGRPAQAYAAVREAMELLRDVGSPRSVASALETAACVLPDVNDGQWHRSARLLLTATDMRTRDRLGPPEDAPLLGRLLIRLRLALGEPALADVRSQVRGTGPLAALNDALCAPPSVVRATASDDSHGAAALQALTPRQSEIAVMVAAGLTNRQIARELGLSEWTVINHLRKVMQKLDCPSRVHVAQLVPASRRPASPSGTHTADPQGRPPRGVPVQAGAVAEPMTSPVPR